MNNIGITGANGFVGRELVKVFKSKNVSFVIFEGNLLDDKNLTLFFKTNKINQVVHLAGTFDPPFSNLINNNVLITQKLLEVGTKFGLKKIIYASSGAVYGEPMGKESFETDSLNPNTLYGLTKMFSEECIKYYSKFSKIKFVIFRFPNIYGPGNKKGVIFNFIKDIKNRNEITVVGNGNQSRDFLYVSDACAAIEKALDFEGSEIFNVSSFLRLSINQLVDLLKKENDFKISYVKEDENLRALSLNIEKAIKLLGYSPVVNKLQI